MDENTLMPIRQVILLFGLFALCVAIVGIAWATGSELYLFVPTGRWGYRHFHRPPTHPSIILGLLVTSLVLTYWFRQNGVYVFILMAFGILLGSAVGFLVFGWTPSWAQHVLFVAMIATSVYAWKQKDYFED